MYLYFGVSKLFQAVINLVILGKTVEVIGLLLKYKIYERIVDRNPHSMEQFKLSVFSHFVYLNIRKCCSFYNNINI